LHLFCALFAWFFLAGGLGAPGTAGTDSGQDGRSEDGDPGLAKVRAEDMAGDLSPDEAGAVAALLIRWREAWERKDLDAYLACYSEKFRYRGGALSAYRRHKEAVFIHAGNITVSMSGFTVETEGEGVSVRFRQAYKSDKHQDVGIKTLLLTREGGKWLILQEDWRAIQ
jgi:hypothetical protein